VSSGQVAVALDAAPAAPSDPAPPKSAPIEQQPNPDVRRGVAPRSGAPSKKTRAEPHEVIATEERTGVQDTVAPRVAEAPGSPTLPEVAALAEVVVVGRADEVWLESAGRRVPPGSVEPGRYTVAARFGRRGWVRTLQLDLRAGQRVVLRCDSAFAACVVEGSG